jgi:hypothetical protein
MGHKSATLCGCPARGTGLTAQTVPTSPAAPPRDLFPYLSGQPGYHKRVKAAAPVLAAVMGSLARQSPLWHGRVRLITATPGAVRRLLGYSRTRAW